MPSGYFSNPIIFLIDVLFGLYMAIVALRIIMQWAKWEYHNPLVQFIVQATQLPVKFLRGFIPAMGRWDMATIVLLIALAMIKLLLITLFQTSMPPLFSFIIFALADIFSLFITIFTVSIIGEVILSWVSPPGSYNPIAPLINRMNSPLLRPIRQWIPQMSGIDFSPLIALLSLQILSMLVLPILTGHG
ncbi:YggT family protein [Methylophaga sp. 41_12_T18]|nr:YggT family protein [Methylophaga sp. 41_12_T18]